MKIILCKSFWSRFRGLMFSKKKNLLFILEKEKPVFIHMFFVFYPINIYYFNENKKLIDKVKAYPFTILKPRKAKYILETTEEFNETSLFLETIQ